MKYQEALNILKPNEKDVIHHKDGWWHQQNKAINTIQELVDKAPYYKRLEARATPMKPKVYIEVCTDGGFRQEYKTYLCKSCDCHIDEEERPYCSVCGQALEWSEDEV